MQTPRVFVSSVIQGMEDHREAARRGIVAAGAEPVLVNEDFPSLAKSSRNACLDAIESCDAVVLLLGERAGWRTPSRALVTEEEYHHARRNNLPVVVFVLPGDREPDAARFERDVSDYVDGHFRRAVVSSSELETAVSQALRDITDSLRLPTMPASIINDLLLRKTREQSGQAILRLVIGPGRMEEIIDPVELGSSDFRAAIYNIGHQGSPPLFDFERPKSSSVDAGRLAIVQEDPGRHGDGTSIARLSIDDHAVIVIETNVTGRAARSALGLAGFVIDAADVAYAASASLGFVHRFFDARDTHKRHQTFLYNAAILGADYRRLVRSPPTGNSVAMRTGTSPDPVPAFPAPRQIARGELSASEKEIDRVLALLERQLQ